MVTLHSVGLWLAAIDPALPRALLVAVIFSVVLVWRKVSPNTWRRYSNIVGVTDDDESKFVAAVRKAWQALPSLVISTGVGVVSSGMQFWPALKIALLGLLPPLIHELGWRYSGNLGDDKPLNG